MQRKQASFTLVEILVVIAIIGIIAALLLPALQSALDSSRQAACANNQRQCGIAIQSYADDWRGHYPLAGKGCTVFWTSFASGATGGTAYVDRGALYCPANPYYTASTTGGGTFRAGPAGGFGGYGMYQANIDTKYAARKFNFYTTIGTYPKADYYQFYALARVKEPSTTPLLADTVSLKDTDPAAYGRMVMTFLPNSHGTSYSTAIHTLHQGRADLLFFDGHVQNLDPYGMYETRLHIDHYADQFMNPVDLPVTRLY